MRAIDRDIERYRAAVRFIEGLAGNMPGRLDYMRDPAHGTLFLDRMRAFLAFIGHPERGMRYVHVTGTAGKGSVAAMIHGALTAAGKRTGLFTSPFVTTSVEKIAVGGRYIAPGEFASIVEELKPSIDRMHARHPLGRPSYFEIFFAIALVYFQRMRCPWAVIEVGCGGRYDATNVIPPPEAAVITNIDYDHVEILGRTLARIAWNKAGIAKRGSPLFTAERRPRLLGVIRRICRAKGAPFHPVAVPADNVRDRNRLLAEAVCREIAVPPAAIARGIRGARLPCRFEIVSRHPLVILDGAHNAAKMRSTAENAARMKLRNVVLVVGMAENKDHREMFGAIVPFARRIYPTRFQIPGRHCADPLALARAARSLGWRGPLESHLDPQRALRAALRAAGKKGTVLVTGSFFLAGELRERWHPEREVLRRRSSFPHPSHD